jgi:hypothetical protein
MAITVDMVLLIIATILMIASALNVQTPVDLWKLGWSLVVLSFAF